MHGVPAHFVGGPFARSACADDELARLVRESVAADRIQYRLL
jgi:hypothetical protein